MNESSFSIYEVKEIVVTEKGIALKETTKEVIGEISLKIYINNLEYVSLLCLNQWVEELALGFLYNEGVIDNMKDVAYISYNERLLAVMINLAEGKRVEKCESLRSVTSGCGQCFTYINPLKQEKYVAIPWGKKYPLQKMLQTMREFEQRSELYRRVGGVHSALFQHADFSIFNEDIGRHNCFDKIAGVMVKKDLLDCAVEGMLYISGRVSSEIIAKVIRLGVPILVSRATPTAAAVNLAKQYQVTLLGYVRGNAGYVYSGEERLK